MDKIKKFFAVRIASMCVDLPLLLIRLVVGAAFLFHGSQNPGAFCVDADRFTGAGLLPVLAAISEFGGGLALILGLLTRLGSLGMAFTMLVAVSFHAFMLHDPFVNLQGGSSYELASVYFTIAIFFVMNGPGRYSLDRLIFGAKN